MSQVLFGALERGYGLPGGILDELWRIESSRGRNMFNPTSGATGHFQIIKPNYIAAGIDPMNLFQSANWTANYARQAMNRFPNLDPTYAIAAHHYGGPNTAMWGPRTRDYANTIVSRMGGVQPAPAVGGVPNVPQLPAMMPVPMPSQQPLNTRDLVRDPRFWFDMAASMNPQQAPMAALVTGLSNAYSRADERRLAFEGGMGNLYAQMQQRMWSQQEKAAQRQWEREKQRTTERRLRDQMKLESQRHADREQRLRDQMVLEQAARDAAQGFKDREVSLKEQEFQNKLLGLSGMKGILTDFDKDNVKIGNKYVFDRYAGSDEDLALSTRTMEMLEKGATTGLVSGLSDLWRKKTGLSQEELAQSQLFLSETSKYLQRVLRSQPGSATDYELQYWKSVSPGPDLTEEANYVLLEILRRDAERNKALGEQWQKYVVNTVKARGNPSYPDFIENKFVDPHPLDTFNPEQILEQFRRRKLQGGRSPSPTPPIVRPSPAPVAPQPNPPITMPQPPIGGWPAGGLPPEAVIDDPSRGGR